MRGFKKIRDLRAEVLTREEAVKITGGKCCPFGCDCVGYDGRAGYNLGCLVFYETSGDD